MVRHQSDEGGETERLGLVGVCLLQQHRRHPFNEFGSAHKVPVHFIQVSELGEVIVNISLSIKNKKSKGRFSKRTRNRSRTRRSDLSSKNGQERSIFLLRGRKQGWLWGRALLRKDEVGSLMQARRQGQREGSCESTELCWAHQGELIKPWALQRH